MTTTRSWPGSGSWPRHPQAVVVLPDGDDRVAQLGAPRSFVPPTSGRSTGSGVDLDGGVDWTEVAEPLDAR